MIHYYIDILLSTPPQNRRTPRQPRPETRAGDDVPLLHPAAPDRLVEGEGDGRGAGVAVFVQVRYHLLHGHAEPIGHDLHDPYVRLMQEEVIDLIDAHPRLLERFQQDRGHLARGEGVNLATVHGHEIVRPVVHDRALAGRGYLLGLTSVTAIYSGWGGRERGGGGGLGNMGREENKMSRGRGDTGANPYRAAEKGAYISVRIRRAHRPVL